MHLVSIHVVFMYILVYFLFILCKKQKTSITFDYNMADLSVLHKAMQ